MKLAFSNIAWNADETSQAYQILADHGIYGIEAAPGILFPDSPNPLAPSARQLDRALRQAADYGHSFVSLQAVHFGLADAALFGSPERRSSFIEALRQAVNLAAALSIPNIVLGSPRHRIRPPELDPGSAFTIAAETLRPLADHARSRGVSFAIEANPERYGTNFMTRFDEAVSLCGLIDDPAFGVNYDFGERLINGAADRIVEDVALASTSLSHVQISAPDLVPPLEAMPYWPALAAALDAADYARWISVEMRRSADDPLEAVRVVAAAITTV